MRCPFSLYSRCQRSKSPDCFAGTSIDEKPLMKTLPSNMFTRLVSTSIGIMLSGISRPVSFSDLRGIGYPLTMTGFLNRLSQHWQLGGSRSSSILSVKKLMLKHTRSNAGEATLVIAGLQKAVPDSYGEEWRAAPSHPSCWPISASESTVPEARRTN
jgi:hypothetical protein